MNLFKKLESWLLYWGSQDERVRAGADKAGHIGFYTFTLTGLIFLVLLVSGPPMSKDQLMWAAVSMMLFPIIIYSIVWILNGVTVMELKIQKRALLVLLILCFPLYGILVWFFYKGDPSNKLFMSLVMALGGTLAVGILVWIINYLAKKKTEVALQDKN